MSDSPIWGRLPCDTEESFAAFVEYRDMRPPRRLIRPGMVSTRAAHVWYKEHDWKTRVAAYDAHIDEVIREERETRLRQASREIAAEHMAMLATARELADRELQKLLEASKASTMPGLVKPAEITKMVEAVVKLDRLVRGETTENASTTVDLSKLSLEEIKALEALHVKAGG